MALTFTPKTNDNQGLENIGKSLSKTKININWTPDNIPNFRDGLNSLMTKDRSNKIINKPPDKRSTEKLLNCISYQVIVAVMKPEYYWTICQSHVDNEQYYQCLLKNNPLLVIMKKIINYVNK